MKACRVCQVQKPLSAFSRDKSKPDGLCRQCKDCQKLVAAKHYQLNKAAICARTAEYRKSNPEVQAKAKRKWNSANRDKNNTSAKARYYRKYTTDIEFKLTYVVRGALRRTASAAKRNSKSLGSSSLPYSPAMLKARIEMNFKPGMTWDNHGEWHIDHRVPVARLIRKGVTDVSVINCLANLSPLWADENYRKGKR